MEDEEEEIKDEKEGEEGEEGQMQFRSYQGSREANAGYSCNNIANNKN